MPKIYIEQGEYDRLKQNNSECKDRDKTKITENSEERQSEERQSEERKIKPVSNNSIDLADFFVNLFNAMADLCDSLANQETDSSLHAKTNEENNVSTENTDSSLHVKTNEENIVKTKDTLQSEHTSAENNHDKNNNILLNRTLIF